VGLVLGYGVSFEDANPWGVGLGLTAGLNLSSVYLGARFVYHFGQSASDDYGSYSIHLWELSFVLGYDIAVAENFILRPNISPGLASLIGELSDSEYSVSGSSDAFTLAGGIAAIYSIQPNVFLGLDLRLEHLFGDAEATGFVFAANGGMRF
jgi:hypothetical protein